MRELDHKDLNTRYDVLSVLKSRFDHDAGTLFLTFEDHTGRQVDFDLRGTLADVRARYRPAPARVGPGRPKLGVIAREVSLLPRHWEWLEQQPNGASGAIRRLVDDARKRNPDEQQARSAIEAAGRFLSAMAGDLPGYEEASRALYARNKNGFTNSLGNGLEIFAYTRTTSSVAPSEKTIIGLCILTGQIG